MPSEKEPSGMKKQNEVSRRLFLRNGLEAAGVWMALPWVIPSLAKGRNSPNERIGIGCIGVGRMGLSNLRNILRFEDVQVVAVCDVDARRADYARQVIVQHYGKNSRAGGAGSCAVYRDFRELIADPHVDVVQICTPDHWHALPVVAAAKAGKDIYVEKPLSLTLQEGRIISDTVRRYGVILQVGSQQRSDERFRRACELVRNGRVGTLHTIKIGMGADQATDVRPPMPVPAHLDYDMWLGPAPWMPYTEQRVHPQNNYDRPGWLRIHDYCLGMITGWGSHHLDIAQWAMDTEHTGPVEIAGRGVFPHDGLWDVPTSYHVEYTYANGVKVFAGDHSYYREGVLLEGSSGWIHVLRGAMDANPKSLLTSRLKAGEIRLYKSTDHARNFLDCIRSRRPPAAPAEVAHRSCSVCILGDIAMRLGQTLKWDPTQERFSNSESANRMLSRSMRSPWKL
jgi:predicted dehydrogenase